MMTKPAPNKDVKRAVVSLNPDATTKFRALADVWGLSDTEIASRLVQFVSQLDTEAQQLVFGLPVANDRIPSVVGRIIDVLVKRTTDSTGK